MQTDKTQIGEDNSRRCTRQTFSEALSELWPRAPFVVGTALLEGTVQLLGSATVPFPDRLIMALSSLLSGALLALSILVLFEVLGARGSGANYFGRKDWWRVWGLLGFSLPRKLRAEIYEPAIEDLKQDLLESSRFRTLWARRWLSFFFVLRTVLLVVDCYRCWLMIGIGRHLEKLLKILPVRFRDWWVS